MHSPWVPEVLEHFDPGERAGGACEARCWLRRTRLPRAEIQTALLLAMQFCEDSTDFAMGTGTADEVCTLVEVAPQ